MEGKGDDTQVSSVYLSKGKNIKTYMTKFVLACRELRKVCRWSHKSSRGQYGISRQEFNTHLEKPKGDEDHDTSCREVLEDAIE